MVSRCKEISAGRGTFYVIALASLFRLAIAGSTGLGIDESYMVAASNRFAASYFDHPLASWWLELGSRRLFGSMLPIVVRLPFVLLAAVTSALLYALTARLYGGRAGFWAVVGYTLSPMFSLAFGCWVLPDGPLDAALLATAYALTRALGLGPGQAPPSTGWWVVAGICAGLALLSKYNAALTLAGALLFMLTDPASRRQLRSFQPWLAAVIAVLIFLPAVGWNAAHGWQSFHYQGGRAAGGPRLHPLAPLVIWGGEALFVLPWIWLPLVIALIGALRRGRSDRRSWLLAMLAVFPVLVFAIIGLWSSARILYHWAAPGYLMLFPLLGDWASRLTGSAARRLHAVAISTGCLLAASALLMIGVVGFSVVPQLSLAFPPGKSPLLQAVDWDSIRGELAARGMLNNPHVAVAALRWYDAGKIGYATRGQIPVTVFGPEPHQFGISVPPESLLGRDILILVMPGDLTLVAQKYRPFFKSLGPAPALTVTRAGMTLLVIPVLLGRELQRPP